MYGDETQGDPDDPLETLAGFPPELLAYGLKLLSWLEATEWHWDLETLLRQDETLLELVFSLKSIGESIREQARKTKDK